MRPYHNRSWWRDIWRRIFPSETERLQSRLLNALTTVTPPDYPQDIVALGWVIGLTCEQGKVVVVVDLPGEQTGPLAFSRRSLRSRVERALKTIAEVRQVQVVLTADKLSSPPRPPHSSSPDHNVIDDNTALAEQEDRSFQSGSASGESQLHGRQPKGRKPVDREPVDPPPSDPPPSDRAPSDRAPSDRRPSTRAPVGAPRTLPITTIIATASGKGGVGKSTVAVNLALAFSHLGYRVGFLDADIYGPSAPTMLNLPSRAIRTVPFTPMSSYGLEVMSIGLLVEADTSIIWRGPMVQSALRQMLFDTNWSELDLLMVDLPPGTGDAQLTLVQKVPLDGVVVVATPQELVLQDVRRGINMLTKLRVPLLGLIENMRHFHCPHCHHETAIFGASQTPELVESYGIPLLGSLPLDPSICQASDSGKPLLIAEPDHHYSMRFHDFARQIDQRLRSASKNTQETEEESL